jgi:hypothetical protein
MTIPDRVDSRWVATLANAQLLRAESQLRTAFRKLEAAEKRRAGSRYMLLQGPPPLVTAWHRWTVVNNETKDRGLALPAK